MTSQPESTRPNDAHEGHETHADASTHTALETAPAATTGASESGARDDDGGRTVTEEFKISGEAVIGKVKELVREGNVRRIVVANEDGRTLLEIPLTIGVIGTVLLPVWAAIGAVAALAANLTLKVERRIVDDADDAPHGDEVAGESAEDATADPTPEGAAAPGEGR